MVTLCARVLMLQVKKQLEGQTLAGLINNAGIANHAVLMHQPIEEFRMVLEINLIGTLAVTQASTSSVHVDMQGAGACSKTV